MGIGGGGRLKNQNQNQIQGRVLLPTGYVKQYTDSSLPCEGEGWGGV